MDRNSKQIASLAGFFSALAADRSIVYLPDGAYEPVTPKRGTDPHVVENPLGRTLQVRTLTGSKQYLNLAFKAGKQVDVLDDDGALTAEALHRTYNFIRAGERVFSAVVAVIREASTFARLRDASCLPTFARFLSGKAVSLKVDHLPLVDPAWADPKLLVEVLRKEEDLAAELKALRAHIRTAPARGRASTFRAVTGGRPFHEEEIVLGKDSAASKLPLPPRVEYGLVDYEPKPQPVGKRLSTEMAWRRASKVQDDLNDVRLQRSLVVLALELDPGPRKIRWDDPQPYGRKGAAQITRAFVGGTGVSCIRGEACARVPTAA